MARRSQPPPSVATLAAWVQAQTDHGPCPDCPARYTDAHWFAEHAPPFLRPSEAAVHETFVRHYIRPPVGFAPMVLTGELRSSIPVGPPLEFRNDW